MIETIPNRTMFGKRDTRHPFKAVLNGQTIAYGPSVSGCKTNAQAILEQTYIAAQSPMVVRVAVDGTVFCARWINKEQMEYWIQHPDLQGSSCMGACTTSLTSYMDKVVADYNACTAPQEVQA